MSWVVNDDEFDAVVALPGRERYEYFVKRAASHGEVWGLRSDSGWVIAVDDEERPFFAVWPNSRYAEACAEDAWADATSRAIPVDDWVEAWTPKLVEDGLGVAVFQTPSDEGVAVPPERLRHDLRIELSLFGAGE